MSIYLQCNDTKDSCHKNPNYDKCLCSGCQAYRKQLNEFRSGLPNTQPAPPEPTTVTSDGSTATYYELPSWARELQDLIRYKGMNGAQAEQFRALYRGEEASHSDAQRQAKKVLSYAVEEVVRTHFPGESMKTYRDAVFAAIFGDKE